jgi:hypothetical protein
MHSASVSSTHDGPDPTADGHGATISPAHAKQQGPTGVHETEMQSVPSPWYSPSAVRQSA